MLTRGYSAFCRRLTRGFCSHYSTLGVTSKASQAEVKKAFNNLAKQCHPDVADDAASRHLFAKVLEAYTVLSNDEKRKEYDAIMKTKDDAVKREPEDPLLKWVRAKYSTNDGTEVPPHVRGEKVKRDKVYDKQTDFENSVSTKILELGLVM